MAQRARPKARHAVSGAAADRLIGRQVELQQLESCLMHASTGAGAFVAIGGPAGIGKTHLLKDFAAACRARGLTVLSGGGLGAELPYAAWRSIIGGLAGGRPASS